LTQQRTEYLVERVSLTSVIVQVCWSCLADVCNFT